MENNAVKKHEIKLDIERYDLPNDANGHFVMIYLCSLNEQKYLFIFFGGKG